MQSTGCTLIHEPVTQNEIAPLLSLPLAEIFPPPGDSISAKYEMDSPGGEDISRPLFEKVTPPPYKNVPKQKNVLNDFFINFMHSVEIFVAPTLGCPLPLPMAQSR